MVKKLHINESFDFDNLNRFVGQDFKNFYNSLVPFYDDDYAIEFGDTAGGDNGYIIFPIEGKKLEVVYEWEWDDDSGLFTKGYKSGKILYIKEL